MGFSNARGPPPPTPKEDTPPPITSWPCIQGLEISSLENTSKYFEIFRQILQLPERRNVFLEHFDWGILFLENLLLANLTWQRFSWDVSARQCQK